MTETEILEQLTHEYAALSVISGNKLIPSIVKERKCALCGGVDHVEDWSNIRITIPVAALAVGVVIGLINYIRAFRKK